MEYNKVTAEDLEVLKGFVPRERILWQEEINEDYSHDELTAENYYPDVVIRVLNAQEVSHIMKYANEHNIPVTVRGAGTGLVGAAVAIHGGIVIETALMNHFLELDEENLTLTLEPGVLLMEISQYVESKGFFYPPDPGEKSATIGGNVSTNAGGMRAVKYGVTRDYVRGLEVVLADGTIMELGGKVVKNSSGYDLKDMIIGSEGTLAVVTKIILKLLPLPAKTISLLVPFKTLADAIGTVPKIVKAKSTPTAIEFMEREVICDAETYLGKKFPDNSSDAYLLLKFDGNSIAEIEENYEEVAQICLESGAIDVLIADTDERNEGIWKTRSAFLEAIKGSTSQMDEVDVVVPRSAINKYLEFVHELRQRHHVRIKSFGHAGDGNLHIYILRDEMDDATWHDMCEKIMKEMYEYAYELRGQVSGEHGIGLAKKKYLFKSLPKEAMQLMAGIKQVFDPKNILNPQKVCQ